ncbi:MAG: DUF4124 domain-containing protein [Rhodanobacter sp.]
MRTYIQALLVSTCFISGSLHAQAYYKWTDAQGVTHYSEKPPATESAQKLPLPSDKSAPLSAEPSAATSTKELKTAEDHYSAQACQAARNELSILSNDALIVDAGSVANPVDPNGMRKLSSEQRDAAKLDADQRAKQFCDHR